MDNPYQSPQGRIITPTGGTNPQSWKEILFSFKGRIPRRQYWGATLIQMVVTIILLVAFAATGNVDEEGTPTGPALIVALIYYIALAWAGLAVTIKRWHDRDKSGWWIFIVLIPIVGAIWAFVETGFLRGTQGPNRFGDDPT